MSRGHEVAVVGGGLVGAACAYELDLIGGRAPAIDLGPFSPARFL